MFRTGDAPRNLEAVREAALPQYSQTGTLHDCLEEAASKLRVLILLRVRVIPTLHIFLCGAVTSCVALRSLFVYFGFSVFVVMCGNGARVLCRARSCFVLSLIVHERATSENTFKGCTRMSRGAQTRDLWFFIRAVFSGTMWCFAEAV